MKGRNNEAEAERERARCDGSEIWVDYTAEMLLEEFERVRLRLRRREENRQRPRCRYDPTRR